jgi:hypothetical protein
MMVQNTLPYTVKEFQNLQKMSSNIHRGGLGPNVGTNEWQSKKQKTEKMNEFA